MNIGHSTHSPEAGPSPDYPKQSRFLPSIQACIATGVYSGYFPLFPGTVGSLLGAVMLWSTPRSFYPLLLIVTVGAGTWAAHAASKRWGKDPSRVVVDEIAGIMLTLALFPKDILLYASGFFLFRIFDIAKPFPCRRLENLPGGYGIMLDDIAAALYACILLYALFIFIN